MKQFYEIFENEKVSTVSTQLTWGHYIELLKLGNVDIINYYIKISEENNLSVRELRERIKSNEYERLDSKTKDKFIMEYCSDTRIINTTYRIGSEVA